MMPLPSDVLEQQSQKYRNYRKAQWEACGGEALITQLQSPIQSLKKLISTRYDKNKYISEVYNSAKLKVVSLLNSFNLLMAENKLLKRVHELMTSVPLEASQQEKIQLSLNRLQETADKYSKNFSEYENAVESIPEYQAYFKLIQACNELSGAFYEVLFNFIEVRKSLAPSLKSTEKTNINSTDTPSVDKTSTPKDENLTLDQLPDHAQEIIASYLNASSLCFFAQTHSSTLKNSKAELIKPQLNFATSYRTSFCYTQDRIYACGDNRNGQLGLGDKLNRTAFTLLTPPPGTIQQVAAGMNHTLVLTSQSLYACGSNEDGKLGLGNDIQECTTFTQVPNLPNTILQVIADDFRTYIVTDEGLYVCGNNLLGELGLDTYEHGNSVNTFTKVALPGIIQKVIVALSHTFVVTDQGLYVCGYNNNGQLGLKNDKLKEVQTTFTRVDNLQGKILQVMATRNRTLVLTHQGLFACGNNSSGQLGLGDTKNRTTFEKINLSVNILEILETSDNFTLLLTDQGVYASGRNLYHVVEETVEEEDFPDSTIFTKVNNPSPMAQLRIACASHTLKSTQKPQRFTNANGLSGIIQKGALAENHTFLLTDQGLYVSGEDNRYGQLGVGMTSQSPDQPFTRIKKKDLPKELAELLVSSRKVDPALSHKINTLLKLIETKEPKAEEQETTTHTSQATP